MYNIYYHYYHIIISIVHIYIYILYYTLLNCNLSNLYKLIFLFRVWTNAEIVTSSPQRWSAIQTGVVDGGEYSDASVTRVQPKRCHP